MKEADQGLSPFHSAAPARGKSMFCTTNKTSPDWNFAVFMGVCTVLILTLFQLPAPVQAENWPQWRGPSSNAISDAADLPIQWNTTENIKWKAPLAGLGASSPIVWEDRIFVTSQKGRIPLQQGMYPLLARDDQDLASRENPIGGRGGNSENGQPGFSPNCTKSTILPPRLP